MKYGHARTACTRAGPSDQDGQSSPSFDILPCAAVRRPPAFGRRSVLPCNERHRMPMASPTPSSSVAFGACNNSRERCRSEFIKCPRCLFRGIPSRATGRTFDLPSLMTRGFRPRDWQGNRMPRTTRPLFRIMIRAASHETRVIFAPALSLRFGWKLNSGLDQKWSVHAFLS